MVPLTVIDRIIDRLTLDENGCWLWGGCITKGYGMIGVEGKGRRVHRLTYEHFVGLIPEGLVIDHLCRVRHCVNPWHLEPVTNRENILRGVGTSAVHARKTHCIHGHEFSAENTEIRIRHGRPERRCRTCHYEWWHKRKERQAVA